MTTRDTTMPTAITWQLARFEELTTAELYEVLRLRQLVFVVEQQCAYLDADGHDAEAWHLMGWRGSEAGRELIACARLFAPGIKYLEASIGRVVTHPDVRGTGLGRALMHEAIARVEELFGGGGIRLSAQRYLERFYEELGFVVEGEGYEEDGIPHVEMVRRG
jgi:ElaA protein